jgi:ADP-heptose:LPS heptosyltransferase
VFRYDKIGDLVATSPLIRALAAHRPEGRLVLVASPYNAAVLQHMPEIYRIVLYDERASYADKLRFARALRRLKPESAFVMSPGADGYLLARLSGARQRAGVVMSYRHLQRLSAPLLLSHYEIIHRRRLDKRPDSSSHVAEMSLRLAGKFGIAHPADIGLHAPLSAKERDWAAEALDGADARQRVLLHLGCTWHECGLDEQGLVALAGDLLAALPQHRLIITAGPADQSQGQAMRTALPALCAEGRAVLFNGLGFAAWNAVIASCCLVITPDTGAVHLGSAHRKQVVAVYNPSRFNAMPSLYGPWQVPHRSLRGHADGPGIRAEVVKAVLELLAE